MSHPEPMVPELHRNAIVDAVKGLAILLVVMGHVLQSHLPEASGNFLYRVIYSFHMPLFMLLAGWNVKPQTAGRIGKTLRRLLPATFCWHTIQYFVEQHYKTVALPTYLLEFLRRPDYGLWFLWTLAFCILILVFCWRLEDRVGLKVYGACAAVLALLPYPYLGIPLIKYFFPYLAIGYGLSRYSARIKPLVPYLLAIAVILYPLLMPLWHQSSPHESSTGMILLAGHKLPTKPLVYIMVKYAEGFLGSILATGVAYMLYARFQAAVFAWLGRYSLEIYVSHQFFIYLFPSTSIAAIIAAFFAALFSAIALAIVLKNIPMLDYLLYGGPLNLRWGLSRA
jgi:fucose 4-O-acetylase-like acetyltransferase